MRLSSIAAVLPFSYLAVSANDEVVTAAVTVYIGEGDVLPRGSHTGCNFSLRPPGGMAGIFAPKVGVQRDPSIFRHPEIIGAAILVHISNPDPGCGTNPTGDLALRNPDGLVASAGVEPRLQSAIVGDD